MALLSFRAPTSASASASAFARVPWNSCRSPFSSEIAIAIAYQLQQNENDDNKLIWRGSIRFAITHTTISVKTFGPRIIIKLLNWAAQKRRAMIPSRASRSSASCRLDCSADCSSDGQREGAHSDVEQWIQWANGSMGQWKREREKERSFYPSSRLLAIISKDFRITSVRFSNSKRERESDGRYLLLWAAY